MGEAFVTGGHFQLAVESRWRVLYCNSARRRRHVTRNGVFPRPNVTERGVIERSSKFEIRFITYFIRDRSIPTLFEVGPYQLYKHTHTNNSSTHTHTNYTSPHYHTVEKGTNSCRNGNSKSQKGFAKNHSALSTGLQRPHITTAARKMPCALLHWALPRCSCPLHWALPRCS
jgi:hypothetical protein